MTALNFLTDPPRFLFFTGKGGVGKTSLACAAAVRLAKPASGCCWSAPTRRPTSARSSAHDRKPITPIAAVPGLSALEIDPEAAAQAYRDRIVGPVRGLPAGGVVAGIEEQLSGPARPRSPRSTSSPRCSPTPR